MTTTTPARVALSAAAFTVSATVATGLVQLDAPRSDANGSHPMAALTLGTGIAPMGVGASTLLHAPARGVTLLAGAGLTLGGILGNSING